MAAFPDGNPTTCLLAITTAAREAYEDAAKAIRAEPKPFTAAGIIERETAIQAIRSRAAELEGT